MAGMPKSRRKIVGIVFALLGGVLVVGGILFLFSGSVAGLLKFGEYSWALPLALAQLLAGLGLLMVGLVLYLRSRQPR